MKYAVGKEQDKSSFASVVGDCKSLVEPMKMAFKQMKKEDSKYRNIIIHGLYTDTDDDYRDRIEELESDIEDVLTVANGGRDIENLEN